MSLDTTNLPPEVVAERFTLRPVRQSDIGLYSLYAGDQRLAGMTPAIPHPLPPGAPEAWVSRAHAVGRSQEIWAIDGTADGNSELMGVISLDRMDEKQAEVSYWVAPPFWNTGLASEAVQALIEANPLDNATLFASVFQDNPASARVLVHCGFEYLGDAESFSVSRNAKVPTWTYLKTLD